MCWEHTSLEAQWQVSSATALTLHMCASHIVWIGADVTIDPFTFAWMYNEAGEFYAKVVHVENTERQGCYKEAETSLYKPWHLVTAA